MMKQALKMETRESRGAKIAMYGEVVRTAPNSFVVHSATSNKEYVVLKLADSWTCECPDHKFRGTQCKHIIAVENLLSIGVE